MKNIIWYLFAGTKGGFTRALIVDLLIKSPSNANQISENLNLDYKTVRHHLKIMDKNKIIYPIEKKTYGTVYFLTEEFNINIKHFQEIWEKLGPNLGKR